MVSILPANFYQIFPSYIPPPPSPPPIIRFLSILLLIERKIDRSFFFAISSRPLITTKIFLCDNNGGYAPLFAKPLNRCSKSFTMSIHASLDFNSVFRNAIFQTILRWHVSNDPAFTSVSSVKLVRFAVPRLDELITVFTEAESKALTRDEWQPFDDLYHWS